ncbi:MAG: PaeR7I family type II restriction endonuclease [Synergistota bacterium]|jgi:type II restriction enzyme|nr:PaeR7I family type II restriction endonuclease [Synergistota bacterium]OPZ40470.1 MAG: Type-2 restriction enzyme PaeR7I [Synergistetes bacterium ADurb.BinA166]
MPLKLAGYKQKVHNATNLFWQSRASAVLKQSETGNTDRGERAAVTAGKNMDGFLDLLEDIVRQNSVKDVRVHRSKAMLTLPGYFRPAKLWDLLVTLDDTLIAAVELKSHVGPSYGNNFNNRAEEAIGSACDFWTAFRKGAFGEQPRPFIGWMMLLEDSLESRSPKRDIEPLFPVFKHFRGTSYFERYHLMCEYMVREGLYTAASVLASPRSAVDSGDYDEFSPSTGIKRFLAALAGHVASEAAARL